MGLDVNNPYKRIGGGSLDQALFKKAVPAPDPTPSPKSEAKPPSRKHTSIHSLTPNSQTLASSSTGSDNTRAFLPRTFNFYEDQINYLTREALQDRLAGKDASMNAWVREAIDDWIAKRKSDK